MSQSLDQHSNIDKSNLKKKSITAEENERYRKDALAGVYFLTFYIHRPTQRASRIYFTSINKKEDAFFPFSWTPEQNTSPIARKMVKWLKFNIPHCWFHKHLLSDMEITRICALKQRLGNGTRATYLASRRGFHRLGFGVIGFGKMRHHEQRIDRSILPLVLKASLKSPGMPPRCAAAAVATTWCTVLGSRAPDGGPSASGAPSWCPAEWNAGSMSCRRTASLPRTHTSGACPRSTGRNTAGRIESNNSRESILKHPFLGPHRNHTLVRIPEYLTLHRSRPVVSLLRLAGN